MNDVFTMGVIQGARQLGQNLGRFGQRGQLLAGLGLLGQAVHQGPPRQQPHHHVADIPLDAVVVHRHDVGMFQRGGSARFAIETLDVVRLRHEFGRHHFHRHVALQARLVAPVDGPHSADA